MDFDVPMVEVKETDLGKENTHLNYQPRRLRLVAVLDLLVVAAVVTDLAMTLWG